VHRPKKAEATGRLRSFAGPVRFFQDGEAVRFWTGRIAGEHSTADGLGEKSRFFSDMDAQDDGR
jgi:hypothetical protein